MHLILQYVRFGAVGLVSTSTHVLMFTAFIELACLAPLLANLAAFGIALLVSFVGHFHWTFRTEIENSERKAGLALARFTAVAITGLLLNSLAVYFIVDLLSLAYPYAIALMISVVPLVLFLLGKFWAFS